MNWTMAHRIAGIAAAQAHRDLGIDRTEYVPVHRALQAAELIGMAQPMPRLFGVYYSPADNGPAILLNATLDVITQRHTAAHELGHHRLNHRTAADNELNPALRWGNGDWPDEEKTAEAFAAWFLMPRPAVLASLERIAQGPPQSPEHVYRVARDLGTSYAGTLRHLVHLRQLDNRLATQWSKIAPAALKHSLSGGSLLDADAHVHAVTAATHQRRIHVDVGDVLVLHLPGAAFGDVPKGLVHLPDTQTSGHEPALSHSTTAVTDEFETPARLLVEVDGQPEPLQLTIVREAPRAGLDEVWPA